VAPSSIARDIHRSAAVYSAILFVAIQIYLNRFSIVFQEISVIYTQHPEGQGFPREPPSV